VANCKLTLKSSLHQLGKAVGKVLHGAVQPVSRPIKNGGDIKGKVVAPDVRLNGKPALAIKTPLREDA